MPKRKDDDRKLCQHGEWYIIRRGTKLYRARYNSDTKLEDRISLRTGDLRVAEERLVKWLAEQYRPQNAPPSEVPLAWVLLNYFQEHASKLPSAEQAKTELSFWTDYWGEAMVSDVTADRVESFITWLKEQMTKPPRNARKHTPKPLSTGYISRVLSSGRAALNRAHKRSMLLAAPFIPDVEVAEARRQKEPKGRPLSMKEMAALLDAVTSEHIWRFCVLALNTMARPDAILELTSSMVYRDHGYINLLPPGRAQTKKRRPIVPITETLAPWLDRWPRDDRDRHRQQIEQANAAGRKLTVTKLPDRFCHHQFRPVKEIDTAWRTLRAIVWPPSAEQLEDWEAAHADLRIRDYKAFRRARSMVCGPMGQKVNPYSIRHTMGRELRRRRVPRDEISIMLGHLPVDENATTLLYSPHDPDYCINAKAAIDEYCAELNRLLKRPDKLILGRPGLRIVGTGSGQ
jgi:integrase